MAARSVCVVSLLVFSYSLSLGRVFSHAQDTFDHDKGQKSAIWGAVSIGFFELSPVDFSPFSPGFLCSLVGKSPQNMERIARFPGREKSVESCHVSGCHGSFGPDIRIFVSLPQSLSLSLSLALSYLRFCAHGSLRRASISGRVDARKGGLLQAVGRKAS